MQLDSGVKGILKRLLCVPCIAIVLVCAVLMAAAPSYLLYSDQPAPADIIVLFVGPENAQRRTKALSLLRSGYADTLFIPAHRSVVHRGESGDTERTIRMTTDRLSWLEMNRARLYPAHIEQTHMEILVTRDFMAKQGCRRALFVSSPYHMRRIKAITLATIPGATERIRFVAARSSDEGTPVWFMNSGDSEWVYSEYLKLCWFRLYQLWTE